MIAHLTLRARFSQPSFEFGVDVGVFVLVLDLIAAFFDALIDVRFAAGLGLVAAPADGEKANRLGAAIEVLMEPHLRRHEDAARPPFDALHGPAFLPHERVAVTSDDEHMNAGSMAMRLLVRADAPQRDMRFDSVVHHAEYRALRAAAAVEAAGIRLTD